MSDSETFDTNALIKICKICNENISKYCCPRCNILYCSLACYKSDSHVQCSESFYKDCINEEMACINSHSESKKKMLEILTKIHESEKYDKMTEDGDADSSDVDGNPGDSDPDDDINGGDLKDSDDEDSVPDLAERLGEVDLDDADQVWEMLTEDERKEFEALINSRDVTKILPDWNPWWAYHREKKLVEEISNSKLVKNEVNYQILCPAMLTKKLEFSHLSRQQPAPCVKWNLLNILASYVYMARFFLGDHHSFSQEAASCLISVCCNLKNGTNFQDAETSIESVMHECFNNESTTSGADTKYNIITDVQCLLRGPEYSNRLYYMKSALSDLHALLSRAKTTSHQSTTLNQSREDAKGEFSRRFSDHSSSHVTVEKEKLKNCIKKIEYYFTYTNQYGSELVDAY